MLRVSVRSGLLAAVCATALLCAAPALAAPVSLDLPAQPLGQSLQDVAHAGGLTLAVDSGLVAGRTAPPLHGAYEPADALRRLLAGTGLTAAVNGTSAVVTKAGGPMTLGPVRVQGNGTSGAVGPNGSSDPTATEGTESYGTALATAGSKTPLSLRQTPQSISVVTHQEILDRNLTDINEVLEQMPGVSLITTNGITPTIVSRGFAVNSYQFDGGAPMMGNTGVPGNNWPYTPFGNTATTPLYDMAEYDHVELIRGSDGMWTGQGNPGGTLNLVRKRPLDHVQITGELNAGQWNNFREMVDVTGPLAFDGRLRGRLVLDNQQNDYFYKTAHNSRQLIYGVVEADVTPTTLLTAGASETWIRVTPVGGLPRYSDGEDLHLPRDTCLCANWSTDYVNNLEGFVRVQQKLGDNWTASFNADLVHNHTVSFPGTVSGTVNPVTLAGPAMGGVYTWPGKANQYSLEAKINGTFRLFGHDQQLLFGVDRMMFRNVWYTQTSNAASVHYTPVNVFNFDPDDYPKPTPNVISQNNYSQNFSNQTMVFATLRLTPIDRVHFIGGASWQAFNFGMDLPSHVVPYGAVTIDATKNLSVYYNYTAIYETNAGMHYGPPPLASTTNYVNGIAVQTAGQILPQDASSLLPPLTGGEDEVGVKGEFFDKKLHVSLAAYRIKQSNEPAWDTRWPYYPGQCCFYTIGYIRSEGFDFEISGQIRPGLEIEASYTNNLTQQKQPLVYVPVYQFNGTAWVPTPGPGNQWGPSPGSPNYSQAPRNLFKVWLNWRTAGEAIPYEWARGLSVGVGVNGQSKAYYSGTACPSPVDIDPVSGFCTVASVPYHFTQGFYAVWSARIGYKINDNWSAGLNIDNLFDRTYYQTVGSSSSGNFYGEPRSVMFSLRATY